MSSEVPLLQISDPKAQVPSPQLGVPLLSSGFRAFFLMAALSAVLLVPAWLYVVQSAASVPYWSGIAWHAHEMIFGYTVAVVAGFLLTAASNWTKSEVASPGVLGVLTLLWLAGRILPLVGAPDIPVLIVDMSFVPALALTIGLALIRTSNRRNYFFLVLLLVLTACNALFHLEHYGVSVSPGLGRDLALRMIALMILVVGGRVFPMFTRNATQQKGIQNVALLDRVSVGLVVLATALDSIPALHPFVPPLWIVAGLTNVVRMSTWGTVHARAPLLWVLHAGYFATALSFILEGLEAWGVVPLASSLHCFTIGGVGLLTIGMMVRVSLGHSGRMLTAPKSMAWAFGLVAVSALVRVLIPIFAPEHLLLSWTVSGSLWTIAFCLFLGFGLPIWFRPRVDGK